MSTPISDAQMQEALRHLRAKNDSTAPTMANVVAELHTARRILQEIETYARKALREGDSWMSATSVLLHLGKGSAITEETSRRRPS